MPERMLLAAALAVVALTPPAVHAGAMMHHGPPPMMARHGPPRMVRHERERVGPPLFARRQFARDFRRFDRRDRFFDGAFWPGYDGAYAPAEDAEPLAAEEAAAPPFENPPYNAGPACPVIWRWAHGRATRHSYCD
ncbi:MAG TPA: hypothetical protein VKU90_16205 [Caulobacteraceae bacterium]|nr:hypothetical protein [Caulobacteraceae bacterium]